MKSINQQKLFRIIDANFNRAKEGLRVCEDVCRFVVNDRTKTRQLKKLRHDLTAAVNALSLQSLIQSRDIERDVGKKSVSLESKRDNINDILYANSQRVKESLRVLEEFSKLLDSRLALELKKIRYRMYALEKELVEKS